jgi:alkanesulfonate monooxygenase SsuD/methylene tetrahydromethanopterin reductase-like flavin-dependent oxidoreductase (luciferase family)
MNRQVYVIDSTTPDEHERARIESLERARMLWRLGDGLRHDSVSYDRGVLTGHPLPDEPPDLEGYAPRVIFGTPDEVLAQFRALRAQGVQEVNLMTEFGFLDFARTRRSIELFGKEVLPALREDDRATRPGPTP